MNGVVWLGVRHLRHDWRKSAILSLVCGLAVFLPLAVWVLSDAVEERLTHRGRSTPLLMGKTGSPLELTVNSIYFSGNAPALLEYRALSEIREGGLADAIGLYVVHDVNGVPVVGAELDYFDYRRLKIQKGRMLLRAGECVVGAVAAMHLGVGPGESVMTTKVNPFDLAGAYPLRMKVVGVMAEMGTADDEAIFCSLQTAWIASGLGHGHEEEEEAVIDDQNGTKVYGAELNEHQEITEGNRERFHFHGDLESLPITAGLIVPHDQKSSTLLEGQYQERAELALVQPAEVVDGLIETIVRTRRMLVGVLIGMSLVMFAVCGLVLMLSVKLRESEFSSLDCLGASVGFVRNLIVMEAAVIVLSGVLLALVGAGMTHWLGRYAVAWVLG